MYVAKRVIVAVCANFHLISRLWATASPKGEDFKAFPFRGRWRDEGATDEVSLRKP